MRNASGCDGAMDWLAVIAFDPSVDAPLAACPTTAATLPPMPDVVSEVRDAMFARLPIAKSAPR